MGKAVPKTKQTSQKGKTGSLRNKLLAAIMPVIIIAIVVIIALATVLSRKYMTEMASDMLDSSIKNQADNISSWVDQNMEYFSVVKHVIESENPDDAELQTILDAYYGYSKYSPNGFFIGTNSGKIYKASDAQVTFSGNVADEPWYKEGITRINMDLGKAHDAGNGELVVSATGTLQNGSDDVAVIGVDVPLNQVSIIVNSGVNMEGASSFLVDTSDNTILADRDASLVSTKADTTNSDKVIAAAANAIANADYTSKVVDGKMVAFREVGTTGWLLVSEVPQSVILSNVSKLSRLLLFIAIIALVVIAAIILLVVRRLMKPISEITKDITAMSSGDFTIKVKATTNDEIGAMGSKVGEFVDSMRGMISSINDESERLSDESKNSSDVSEEMHESANAQAEAMNQLNQTVDQLAEAVNEIAKDATTLAGVVSDTKQNTDDATESMNETVGIASSGRDEMRQLSAAMGSIEETNNKLVESINKVGDASERITKIVSLISEIAEQTNLLSLNASIEAARAGEAGKGFAVVADEIGKLANNSDESAKNIGGLIEEVNALIGESVKKAAESSESIKENTARIENAIETFDKIYGNIEKTNGYVASMAENIEKVDGVATNVAAISEEQAASADEIQATSQSMVEQAKQIADNSEKVSESARELSEMSETLSSYVRRFKL